MAATDLSSMTDEQLVHRELSLERELLETSFRLRTGQLDNTARLKNLRRDIARAKTEQRSRERSAGLAPDSLRGRHRATFQPGQQAGAEGEGAQGQTGGFLRGVADRFGLGESADQSNEAGS